MPFLRPPKSEWIDEIDLTSGLSVSLGTTEVYRRSWLVVYSNADTHAAFVPWLLYPSVWEGAWTYDPEKVKSIQQYIIDEF